MVEFEEEGPLDIVLFREEDANLIPNDLAKDVSRRNHKASSRTESVIILNNPLTQKGVQSEGTWEVVVQVSEGTVFPSTVGSEH